MEPAPHETISAHTPVELVERVKNEATRRNWSRSRTINEAVTIGITALEAQTILDLDGVS